MLLLRYRLHDLENEVEPIFYTQLELEYVRIATKALDDFYR